LTDARDEAECAEEHAQRDSDDDAVRGRVGEVVDEQAEERAADDATDQEAAETEQVASPEGCGLKIVWHRPKLPQDAAPMTRRRGPGLESRFAVVSMAAVLCQGRSSRSEEELFRTLVKPITSALYR
jgi:hypothetical protein